MSRKTSCYLWELQTPPGVAVPHLQSLTQLPALHLNPVCVCVRSSCSNSGLPKLGFSSGARGFCSTRIPHQLLGQQPGVAEFSPSAELSTQMEFVMMWKNPFK